MPRLTTLAAASVIAVATISATPALAAKGGNSKPAPTNGSTLELVVLSGPDSLPNWGEDVTFKVATTATTEPHVDLACTQGGRVVLSATAGWYDSYLWPGARVMNLSSESWTGGAADCTARLYAFARKGQTTYKTITFRAEG